MLLVGGIGLVVRAVLPMRARARRRPHRDDRVVVVARCVSASWWFRAFSSSRLGRRGLGLRLCAGARRHVLRVGRARAGLVERERLLQRDHVPRPRRCFSNTANTRSGSGSSSSANRTTGAVTHASWPSASRPPWWRRRPAPRACSSSARFFHSFLIVGLAARDLAERRTDHDRVAAVREVRRPTASGRRGRARTRRPRRAPRDRPCRCLAMPGRHDRFWLASSAFEPTGRWRARERAAASSQMSSAFEQDRGDRERLARDLTTSIAHAECPPGDATTSKSPARTSAWPCARGSTSALSATSASARDGKTSVRRGPYTMNKSAGGVVTPSVSSRSIAQVISPSRPRTPCSAFAEVESDRAFSVAMPRARCHHTRRAAR